MSSFIKGLEGPIAIIGMGISGKTALQLLKKLAPEKKILTFDDQPGAAEWSDLDKMISSESPKTLVVSPGVPLSRLKNVSGKKITSELAIAQSCLTSEKIIGVTGSVGKSTTAALLEKALQASDPANLAAGNIGKPLAEYVLELLDGERKIAQWIVLELSSFQLENYENLAPEYSVITFFTANHLERYKDISDYYLTKWLLVGKTRKKVFINGHSPDLTAFAKKSGANEKIIVSKVRDLKDSLLLGSHNQQNLALAADLIDELKLGNVAHSAIKNFPGLPHRLENLGTFGGVRFVNDSKATALDSVYSAVSSLVEDLPGGRSLYVLLGGKDKNLPWEWLNKLEGFSQVKPIYFGECGKKARAGTQIEGPVFPTLGPAIEHAFDVLKSGDTLLLSPGGSSLDEFKNFEARGDFFRSKVTQYS
jgi:UDP-N-acetylmuramoylalanine--D-glutamate ligase